MHADYTPVTLVDRAASGGFEFVHDGRPWVFKPGQVELAVPHFVAEFALTSTQLRVWTTDGRYVCRLAVENPPRSLLDSIGPEAGDCSVIEIDTGRLEGWEAPPRDPSEYAIRKVQVPTRELRERQGSSTTTFGPGR